MIEGTPQLHVNAWKISSACVSPVNIPIIDPCEMNQQNGTRVTLMLIRINIIIAALKVKLKIKKKLFYQTNISLYLQSMELISLS